jgi:hypothetical protein
MEILIFILNIIKNNKLFFQLYIKIK